MVYIEFQKDAVMCSQTHQEEVQIDCRPCSDVKLESLRQLCHDTIMQAFSASVEITVLGSAQSVTE